MTGTHFAMMIGAAVLVVWAVGVPGVPQRLVLIVAALALVFAAAKKKGPTQ